MLHLGQIGFYFYIAIATVWVSYVVGKELAVEWLIPSWMRYGVFLSLFAFILLASWTELGSVLDKMTDQGLDYAPLFRPSLSKLEWAVLLLFIFVVPGFIGIVVGEKQKSAENV
jgi:hypothetical protein